MALGTAMRAFFKALFNPEFSQRVRALLDQTTEQPAATAAPAAAKAIAPIAPAGGRALSTSAPARSDAINLLAVLQRESRLIDFLQENLDGYADAQIGAAVRDVHRDAAKTLQRVLALVPVLPAAEGSKVNIPAGAAGGRVRLIGAVGAAPPNSGTLRHGGWEAAALNLPEWTGPADAARVIAPAEIEV